ncbi:hypothetical protein CR513_04248, partial [Mucuna pruriens]
MLEGTSHLYLAPLSEKEMVKMFIDTLQPSYEKMVGNVSLNFSDLVIIRERVEVGMRKGKIALEVATSHTNKSCNQRKEGETNMVVSMPNFPHHQYPSQPRTTYQPPLPTPRADLLETRQSNADNGPRGRNNLTRTFTSIPMSHTKLLTHLSYDQNAKCDYHAGTIGHATKKCRGLKHKVQYLINAGLLSFKENNLNVESNPSARMMKVILNKQASLSNGSSRPKIPKNRSNITLARPVIKYTKKRPKQK